MLRGAIEHGWPDELIELETPTHRVWVTGGPSWGGAPGDLVDPAVHMAEAGVTDAAGFDGHTRYTAPVVGSRSFRFSAGDLPLTRFGVTAAHASAQAAGLEHPPPGSRAQAWLTAWLSELDAILDGQHAGRGLLRFAARGFALSAWLRDPASPVSPARIDERARALAQVADDGGLVHWPRRRSSRIVARELRQLVEALRPRFQQLDDPAAREDEDARWFIENAGGTFGDALEVEVAAHPLFAGVVALTDLHGDDVAQLLDVPPTPITSQPPGESETRFAPLAHYLSLIVVGDIDWAAAERAVKALHPEIREGRRVDLAELQRLVAATEYRRYATYGEPVGAHRLYIAAPHGDPDEPDVAPGIGRLGRDGVLDAAGVIGWSAPDPDYRGPVEPYVPGYGPRRR